MGEAVGHGRTVIYYPGDESSAMITARTASGSWCKAWVKAKPASECPNCDGAAIGYTTLQMSVGQSQNLTITAPPGCNCYWLLSGGGSISAGSGPAITYTAPETNENCSENPTLTAVCNGAVLGSLSIAVNAWTAGDAAIRDVYCAEQRVLGVCGAQIVSQGINCSGVEFGGIAGCSTGQSQACEVDEADAILAALCAATWGSYASSTYCPGGVTEESEVDVRTAAMIEGGCCPYQLV